MLWYSHDDFKKRVNVKGDGVTTETFSCGELALTPAQTKELEIELYCKANGSYDVTLWLTEKSDGGLKNFVLVEVLADGEQVHEGGLSDLLKEDVAVKFDSILHDNKATVITIRYTMPEDMGNEAQNTYAAFDITIKIEKK